MIAAFTHNDQFYREYIEQLSAGTLTRSFNRADNKIPGVSPNELTTRVGYRPSTHFALEDEQHAATRWRTPLPFPVQVVARVEVLDDVSRGKLTTAYRYRHGYCNGNCDGDLYSNGDCDSDRNRNSYSPATDSDSNPIALSGRNDLFTYGDRHHGCN